MFAFAHAQASDDEVFTGPEVFIGSADLMHRNLDRRVEALVRVSDPDQVAEIVDLVDESVAPTTSSWHLEPDGSWRRHSRAEDGTPLLDQQSALITRQRRRPGTGL